MNKKSEEYIYYLVGKNIRKYRLKKGLTVVKFARLCNYSEGYIMNIESEKYLQTFSVGTLYTFAMVLDVDIKCFFDKDE